MPGFEKGNESVPLHRLNSAFSIGKVSSNSTVDESMEGFMESGIDGNFRSSVPSKCTGRRKYRYCLGVVLAVAVCVVTSLISFSKESEGKNAVPTLDEPDSTATPPAASPTIPSPVLISQPTLHPTVADPLTLLDADVLTDTTTPIGRAYQWIQNEDDFTLQAGIPITIQRLILAALYFGSGGETTVTTWEVCGAVPTDSSHNAFSATRCVSQGEVEICATEQAFLECPEYYERYNATAPKSLKKRWLSRTSECNWFGIQCNNYGQVTQVALPNNGLQGPLLKELDLLTELNTLDLGGNAMTGELPEWRGWEGMQHLILYKMNVEGQVPETWKLWHTLQTLDLADNNLEGALVLPGNWKDLHAIMVDRTGFDVTLRSDIQDMDKLQVLRMSDTNVVGGIPTTIGSLTTLGILDLSSSHITGTIPSEIGLLTNLGTYTDPRTQVLQNQYKFSRVYIALVFSFSCST